MKHERYHSEFSYHELVSGNAMNRSERVSGSGTAMEMVSKLSEYMSEVVSGTAINQSEYVPGSGTVPEMVRNRSERVPGNGMTVGTRSRIRNRAGNGLQSVGMSRNEFPEWNDGRNVFPDPELRRKRSGIGRNESEWVPGNGMTVGMRSRIRNCTGNDPESVGMNRNGFPEME